MYVFIVAYLSPRKDVLVLINTANESNLELILLFFFFPFMIYTIVATIRGYRVEIWKKE